ncbi:MAG: DUF2252 domain-containing protein [Solirubrobacteraceae bacterium]
MTAVDDLAGSDDERREHLVEVLVDAFADLIERDERAFRRKFRKMAADPFAFYRGTAPLFYADVASLEDPWVDEATSRVWIQGDLHAENYGTYMDAAGVLVFDVNDFDEAYLGHYTWDLQRMVASLALLGFSKALSDATVRGLVEAYATAYAEQVAAFATTEGDEEFRLTLDTTEGAVLTVLEGARMETRVVMLDRMTDLRGADRRFSESPGARRLEDDERSAVLAAYQDYLATIPEAKRLHSISYRVKDVVGSTGFGIGSAGLRAYNLLVEGRSQALENDIVLSMKQGQVPAPSRVVRDARLDGYFEHEGHRTAVSQQALQAHADPWVGWCALDGVGQVIKELSPYEADLDWGGVTEPDEMLPLVRQLGRATAKIHCVSDAGSGGHPLVAVEVEEAITAVIGDRVADFAADLAAFGAAYGALTRDDHRRFVDAFRNGQIRGLPAD